MTIMQVREPAPVSWPAPESDIATAVRASLGRRLPPGTPRHRVLGEPPPEPVDRYGLLVDTCHRQTAALAVLWLNAERRQGRGTRVAYADDLIHWGEWLKAQGKPRLDLMALQRSDIALWLTHQRSLGRAKATIARRLAALSSLYRYANSYGLQLVCPIHDDEHRPRIRAGRRATSARVLSPEQVSALFRACIDVRDAAVLGLLFTDGLRVGEACGANEDDYDPGQRTVRVVRKGDDVDDPTCVQVAPIVATLLNRWLETRPPWNRPGPVPLLLDAQGGRLTRDGVARTLRRLARAAEIPHPQSVTPHSLRASAITDQIKRGKPLVEVQSFANHKDVRTTMGYFEDVAADERNASMAADLSRLIATLPSWVAAELREDDRHAA